MAQARDGAAVLVPDDDDESEVIEISLGVDWPVDMQALLRQNRMRSVSIQAPSFRAERPRPAAWGSRAASSVLRSETPAVIDLTDSPDSPERRQPPPLSSAAAAGRNPRRTNSQRTWPPQLSRSDSTFIAPEAVIDLTGEGSDDGPQPVDFSPRPPRATHGLQRPARNHHHHHRHHHHHHRRRRVDAERDHLFELELLHDGAGFLTNLGGDVRDMVGNLFTSELLRGSYGPAFDSLGLGPFGRRQPSPKPPMEEIAPTRPGFTRNTRSGGAPGEETIVICPACGEELAYDPTDPAPQSSAAGKKRKRAPGDHHFWVLKKCGHVYCADCFENRKPTKASPGGVGFGGQGAKLPTTAPSDIRCAVDGCETKAATKSEWVGIFL